jgi:hypothetical protein
MDRETLKIKKRKKPDYKALYPQAGQRSNEGQRQMKERLKHGDMHLHYGYPDTAEGKARYKKDKKEYDLY